MGSGPPTKFKSGTFTIIFRHCLTYFVLDKYIYIIIYIILINNDAYIYNEITFFFVFELKSVPLEIIG